MSSTDYALETLLDMDGERFFYESGHWHKIMARKQRRAVINRFLCRCDENIRAREGV